MPQTCTCCKSHLAVWCRCYSAKTIALGLCVTCLRSRVVVILAVVRTTYSVVFVIQTFSQRELFVSQGVVFGAYLNWMAKCWGCFKTSTRADRIRSDRGYGLCRSCTRYLSCKRCNACVQRCPSLMIDFIHTWSLRNVYIVWMAYALQVSKHSAISLWIQVQSTNGTLERNNSTYLQMPMILLMVSGNTRKILSFCPLRCCFVSLYAV